MALTLTFTASTTVPVEIPGVTPDRMCHWSLKQIAEFKVAHGNRQVALETLFELAGDPSDGRFVFKGDLTPVHWLGASMESGRIDVDGNVGRHLGHAMSGGMISVAGSASDWVGGQMRGGSIRVQGNAGHLTGAAQRGSPRGMTGGVILVHGSSGDETGRAMRRGLIAIGGDAGQLTGFHMLAGTIVILGQCGKRCGAEMKRGTLALLGPPTDLLPTFDFGCRFRPVVLPMVSQHLIAHGFVIPENLLAEELALFHGDRLAGGRGEILQVVDR